MKKILIALRYAVGTGVLLIAGFILLVMFLVSSNNRYKGEYKAVFNTSEAAAKKALVVFQPSFSKTSTEIANHLAKGLNQAGYEVTVTYPGKHVSTDVKEYSVLVFGSPVFAGQPSSALTEYMKKITHFKNKKILLYAVGADEKAPELIVMEKSLKGAGVYKKLKFIVSDKNNINKAYDLGSSMKQGE